MLQRMLMLQHRALFGDRPLPLSSVDSSAASEANAGAGTCSSGISDWEAQFASEQAEPQPQTPQAAAFAAHFPVVVRAFNEGAWDTAQDLLYQLCLAGQTTAQAYEMIARATSDGVGGAAGAAGAAGVAEETPWFGYAQRVTAWLQDCTTLVQYVPRQPPVREDHKRLLMLLHDLGGSLVLLQLLGVLGEALVGFAALGELAELIGGAAGLKIAVRLAGARRPIGLRRVKARRHLRSSPRAAPKMMRVRATATHLDQAPSESATARRRSRAPSPWRPRRRRRRRRARRCCRSTGCARRRRRRAPSETPGRAWACASAPRCGCGPGSPRRRCRWRKTPNYPV